MRTAWMSAVVVAFIVVASAKAQQSDPPVPESVKRALAKPPQSILNVTIPPLAPRVMRLGVLTLVPSGANGEIAKVGIPIGDLTMRAVRAIARAQHRRTERKARERVQRDVRDFLKAEEIKSRGVQ